MKRHLSFTIVLLSLAAPLAAQQFGAGMIVSTLGLGGELSYRTGQLGFRGGYYFFNYTREDATIEGIRYDVNPRLRNAQLGVDVYPLRSLFRISGGLTYGSSNARGIGVLDQPITIGGQTYAPSQVGELSGELAYQRKWMPWAGLGLATEGRVGFTFDLGVMFAGHPTISLRATGGNLTPTEEAVREVNVAMEQAQIQQAIDDEKLAQYYPLVALGIRIKL
jgi:hypothetical protein